MKDIFQRKWRIVKGDPVLFHVLEQAKATLVKENPRRRVWLAELPDDTCFYVKYEKLPCLHAIFSKPARTEYENAEMLASLNIPCVHFTHYATCGVRETLLISEAVRNVISAKEFWFTETDEKKRSAFLGELRLLIAMLLGNHIRHGDFHAGNLLVERETAAITLVDPLKITTDRNIGFSDYAGICANFLPGFTVGNFRALATDFTANADEAFAEVIRRNEELIDGEWERRKVQILSGNSKFSRTVECNGRVFEVAATVYFAPQGLPADMDVRPYEEMDSVKAEGLWLQQFNDILKGKAAHPQYLVREKLGDKQRLYR